MSRTFIARRGCAWRLLGLLALPLLAACGDDSTPSPTPTPAGIAVTCSPVTTGHACKAVAQLAAGTTRDVTTVATWSSSNPGVATIDAAGRVTDVSTGVTEIRATYQGIIGGTTLVIGVAAQSMTVSCVPATRAHQCTATARFSNNTTQDVTGTATWASSNTNVATVDAAGRVTHVADGQTDITARYQNVLAGTILTLSNVATVTSVSVACTPGAGTHQCMATAQLSDGGQEVVTSRASWTSTNALVASVDGNGLVQHLSTGQTDIRATYRNVTGSSTLAIVIALQGASVVINELSSRGINGTTDEFIELRNDTPNAVNVGGWQIMRSDVSGSVAPLHTLAQGLVLGPGCHYLLAHQGFVSFVSTPDVRYQAGGFPDDGGVALVRADGAIVDQVGMSQTSTYREGTPLDPLSVDPNTTHTYARTGYDTNNNRSDFALQSGGTPQSLSSPCGIR